MKAEDAMVINLSLNTEEFTSKLRDAHKAVADGNAPMLRFAVLELVVRFGGKSTDDPDILTLVSSMVKYVTDGTLPE